MDYFLDTEFDEDGKKIELISLGLVAQDGRELYCVSNEFDPEQCNDWVKANVLNQLPPALTWVSRSEIKRRIVEFVGMDPSPRFWAYFADYDWVVFCQLFGAMVNLPKGFPMYCLDIKQWQYHLGITQSLKAFVPQMAGNHDALCDARWNRDVHAVLTKYAKENGLQR